MAIALVAGCAGTQGAEDAASDPIFGEEISDPFENVNRAFFEFNMALDRALLRPVTRFYVDYVPAFVREGVHNILITLNSPIVAANDLVQGKVDRFGATAGRTVVNVTLGLGFIDVAGELAPPHNEDFGQTLAVWGAPSGAYLVLPFLGPSTVRDAIGFGVEAAANPITLGINEAASSTVFYAYSGSKTGATVLDARSQVLGTLEELERTSLDFYAAVRSLWWQNRLNEIRDGEPGDPVPIPDITFDPEPAPASGSPSAVPPISGTTDSAAATGR